MDQMMLIGPSEQKVPSILDALVKHDCKKVEDKL